MFVLIDTGHAMRFSSCGNVKVKRVHTSNGDKEYSVRGPSHWNGIDETIRDIPMKKCLQE